jgi:hypothetical protein
MLMRTFIAGSVCFLACSSDREGGRSDAGVVRQDARAEGGAGGEPSASAGAGGAISAGGKSGSASGGVSSGAGGAGKGTPGVDASAPGVDAASPPSESGIPSGGPAVDRTDPKLHEFVLDPHELDPSVKDSLETEYADLDTRAAPLGKLVIFLGGYTNPPVAWRDHGKKLAEFGFHAVLPAYNNRWSGCTGADCDRNTRWEALVGEDVSSAIVASRADSAEGRVVTILKHLATADPGGDWGYYLDAEGNLLYDRAIIAGISHGAASTGVYASRRGFFRAVMHSGGWGNPGANPLTPVSEWFGFAHTADDSFDPIVKSWDDAKMLGSRTSIDGQSPPYGGAHKLITSEASDYPHGSTAVHSSSPKKNGVYVFDPAWRHLYGVADLSR